VNVAPVTPTGRTITVAKGASLQAAIDAAKPGDVLLLAAGATYTGNFTLPKKTGDAWITIRTSTPDSKLPVGKRVTSAQGTLLAKIVSPNGSAALKTKAGAHHYRLIGLDVRAKSSVTSSVQLVAIGSGSASTQPTVASAPHHIVIDRRYISGADRMKLKNCVELHGAHLAVVNSSLVRCHSKTQESHAIIGWNGPGPFLIENNYIAGAGVNVMFGGADPASVSMMPADITVRRNHVRKVPTWKDVWLVKNLLELKLGRRVLVEGNVFENSWRDGQNGFALVLKSENQGGRATWSETSDVTVRYNVIRNTAHGVSASSNPGGRAVPASRIRFEHNRFEKIGTGTYPGGRLFQLSGIDDFQIEHNTGVSSHSAMILTGSDLLKRLTVRDNVFAGMTYGVSGDGKGWGTAALDGRSGAGWVFSRNVFSKDFSANHPSGNYYASSVSRIGFVSYSSLNLALSSSSTYKGKASDGTDPGANLTRLATLTAGVVQ